MPQTALARCPCWSCSKFPVAQKYIANPMLIDGRKFGIRLWAVLTSTTPLRAYLHDRGLVLFSSNTYDMGREHVSMDGTSGHLTNAFQNAEGTPPPPLLPHAPTSISVAALVPKMSIA